MSSLWEFGHEVLRCYHRFDHSFQAEDTRSVVATTIGYNVDWNWYADSGTTNHLTCDLDRLSMHERHKGTYQVQVANGTGLKISHIGRSTISS